MAISLPITGLLGILALGQATQNGTLNAYRKFSGVIFNSNILVENYNVTPIYCITVCMRDLDCMSYLYANNQSRCIQYKTVFHNEKGSVNLPGADYYVVGIQGYVPGPNSRSCYHVGVTRDGSYGWRWRDGTNAFIHSYWLPGEPKGVGSCVGLCPHLRFLWNDARCKKFNYMCEIDIN